MTQIMPASVKKQMEKYTPFQQSVWKVCYHIPAGEMRSYGWIAKRLGRPNASRAVGAALRANPFAPIIPCHRVVRSDGGMGGYSGEGGIKTKRKMLEAEGALLN